MLRQPPCQIISIVVALSKASNRFLVLWSCSLPSSSRLWLCWGSSPVRRCFPPQQLLPQATAVNNNIPLQLWNAFSSRSGTLSMCGFLGPQPWMNFSKKSGAFLGLHTGLLRDCCMERIQLVCNIKVSEGTRVQVNMVNNMKTKNKSEAKHAALDRNHRHKSEMVATIGM